MMKVTKAIKLKGDKTNIMSSTMLKYTARGAGKSDDTSAQGLFSFPILQVHFVEVARVSQLQCASQSVQHSGL